jgi:hypothetical protein
VKKWEYAFVTWEQLDEYGRKGWRFTGHAEKTDHWIYMMEREVPDPYFKQ